VQDAVTRDVDDHPTGRPGHAPDPAFAPGVSIGANPRHRA
jgi:hypothetical protein